MNDLPRTPLPDALTALLAAFQDRLRALVRQRCPHELGIDPDEVEQEVRIRLWKALQGEKTLAHPASYLHKTALSVIVDLVRRHRARPDLSMGQTLDTAFEADAATHEDGGPERTTERQAFSEAVLQAVAALPERRRRPVQLHLQGFGTAQIGVLLQISEPTARNLVYRGLDELRERLAAQGWGHEL
jgi:RNA polymerase sigma factor (sigma-70 family)